MAEVLPQAKTLAGQGWLELRNGELLRLAEGQFDLLLTMDKGILYQHNHRGRLMRIAVLSAPNSRIESLIPLLPNLNDFIGTSLPGTLAIIREDSVVIVAGTSSETQ
ncbi:MAG: hypothetical protein K1X67_10880 [Fimbriimonadaceae bacterium]|nr:hypothetical protein [Fimbriimonadaceae bacterium]